MQKMLLRINQRFQVDKSKVLGRGAFGTVYKGYDRLNAQIIAVKALNKHHEHYYQQYVMKQIQTMEELMEDKHPNIMGYYGHLQNENQVYLFLQFCKEGSLDDFIKRGQVSEIKALSLFGQLLQAMVYVNSRRKLHRDLKPANILLDQHFNLKIGDFGLCRDIAKIMTEGVCSKIYAAPQVLNNKKDYNEKCDVWSVGLILYQMLTGKQLFQQAKSQSHLKKLVDQFKSSKKRINYPQQLHHEWENLTMMLVSHDLEKRLSFSDALEAFNKIEPKMRKDIQNKYKQQDQPNTLKLTSKVSPYQAKLNQKKDMKEKMEQQESYNRLINLSKYLKFFRIKTDMLIRLMVEFTNNKYETLRNIRKYLLMFLTLAAFISKTKAHLKQITDNKIKIIDQQAPIKKIRQAYPKQADEILTEFSKKNTAAINKFQNVLKTQIINKIEQYLTREQQNKIFNKICLNYGNIFQMIKQSVNGVYQPYESYMTVYRKLINDKYCYKQNKDLSQVSLQDLKTYAHIRILANLDVLFPDQKYKCEDFIRMKKQKIQNQEKGCLIEFVKKIN